MRIIKSSIIKVMKFLGLLDTRFYRYIRTKGFSCGLVALGERNNYSIPAKWITVDIENADFNINFLNFSSLPFQSESVQMIYSSHMIEYLPPESFNKVIKECYRVLKKGGVLRIEAPDAKKIIYAYKNNIDDTFLKEYQIQANPLITELQYPNEYASRHVTFLGLLSCYIEHGRHIPVVAKKSEIDQRLSTLSLDDFGEWAVSLQTQEQKNSGGHINIMYYDKISELLRSLNFKNDALKNFKTTDSNNPLILSLERLDKHRNACSFIVECFK